MLNQCILEVKKEFPLMKLTNLQYKQDVTVLHKWKSKSDKASANGDLTNQGPDTNKKKYYFYIEANETRNNRNTTSQHNIYVLFDTGGFSRLTNLD